MLRWSLELLASFLVVYLVVMSYHMVSKVYGDYLKESECANNKVQLGVPRKDIATGNGICWVQTNGYYKGK